MKVVKGSDLLELGSAMARLNQAAEKMIEEEEKRRKAALRSIRIVAGFCLTMAFLLGALTQWLIFG